MSISTESPAPSPVPNVRKTILSAPLPAPNFHSATAQALASFCSSAGTPKCRDSCSEICTSFHPGRFGGPNITPLRESSGPPQDIPIFSGFSPPKIFSADFIRLSIISSGEISKRVAHFSFFKNSIFSPCTSAVITAHFVPPISKPSIKSSTVFRQLLLFLTVDKEFSVTLAVLNTAGNAA